LSKIIAIYRQPSICGLTPLSTDDLIVAKFIILIGKRYSGRYPARKIVTMRTVLML
jgi:hypothetical protein